MTFRLLVFFLSLLTVIKTAAQPMIKLDNEDRKFIGRYTHILEDSSAKLSIEEVIRLDKKFAPVKSEVFNSSPSNSAFWVKFNLKNNLDKTVFMEIDNPTLKELEVYSVDGNEISMLSNTGTSIPFYKRAVLRNNFIIHLNLEPGESKTFYIRYTSLIIMGLPISFGTAETIMERNHIKDLAYGVFFGILLVTVLYNFFLFISTRDITYLYYVAYITGFMFLQASLLGYFFRLFPNSANIVNHVPFVTSGAAGILCLIFVQSFLQTKKRALQFHKIGYYIQALFFVGIVVNLMHSQHGEMILSIAGLLVSIYMLVVGIVVFNSGYSPARYYLLATFFSLLSIAIYILKGLNILPYTEITNNVMAIGIAIEAILFSFALGDRYTTIEKENKRIQSELNDELMLKVEERTKAQEELTKSNKRLKTINNDLDNFIYTASHDLRAPISNLEGLLTMLKESKDTNEREAVVKYMAESVEKFKDTIMELTEISKIQKESFNDVQKIELKKLAEDTIELFRQQIEKDKIKITYIFDQCPAISFSRKNLKSIFYNLVSNAIKYKSENRRAEILITCHKKDQYMVITFKDNGIGIPQAQFDIIFKMFKRYHTHIEGTGVGLYIIKRIIENSGGKIEVDSKVGQGSEFRIYLKNQEIE